MQFSGKTQSTLVDHIVQDHRDITCACYWGLGSYILLTGPQAHDDQQGVDSQTDCSNHFLDLRHRSYSDSTTVAQQICGVGSPTNLTLAQTSCLETNCKRLHTGYSGHWGLGSHYTLTGLPEYSFHAGIRNCAEFYIGVGSLIFDSLAPFLDTQQLSNNTFASEEHQFSGVGSLLFDSLAQFLHSAQPHFLAFAHIDTQHCVEHPLEFSEQFSILDFLYNIFLTGYSGHWGLGSLHSLPGLLEYLWTTRSYDCSVQASHNNFAGLQHREDSAGNIPWVTLQRQNTGNKSGVSSLFDSLALIFAIQEIFWQAICISVHLFHRFDIFIHWAVHFWHYAVLGSTFLCCTRPPWTTVSSADFHSFCESQSSSQRIRPDPCQSAPASDRPSLHSSNLPWPFSVVYSYLFETTRGQTKRFCALLFSEGRRKGFVHFCFQQFFGANLVPSPGTSSNGKTDHRTASDLSLFA